MGRFLRSRWFPLGLGLVLSLSAVSVRREARPRKATRPRASGAAVRVPPLNLESPKGESLPSSAGSRFVEGDSGAVACTMDCDPIGAGISWEDAVAYAVADFQATATADFAFAVAWDWDPLTSDTLEKDLELTPAQKARIDDLRARYKSEEELWRSHSLLESEVERRLEELRERYRDLIRRELSPEQQATYDKLESQAPKRLRAYANRASLYLESAQPSDPWTSFNPEAP